MKNILTHKKSILIIGLFFIFFTAAFCAYQHLQKTGLLDPKESLFKNYQSVYSHFRELTASNRLRRGSFKFSFFKEVSFIRYLPFQFVAFLKNFASCNFWISLFNVLLLSVFFAIFGIPLYSKNIPLIFVPLLGFINLVIVFVFLLYFHAKYSFSLFLSVAAVTSILLVLWRLLINKDCYKIRIKQVFKDKEGFILPAVLFLIGLFIISGHLGHLDIPRSYDHMSYSTLSSLLKIERTFPKLNIYAFPSLIHINLPSGWLVIVSFISELLNIAVVRTQLILVMLFFPFLGVGVYYICRHIFKESGWAFCAGALSLTMRMGSYPPVDGDMPEVLEWALVGFALFALFSYFKSEDKRFFLFSALAFFVSMIVHVKLTLFAFMALLFSAPFILFKYGLKETIKTVFVYALVMGSVYFLALPHILSMHTGYKLLSSKSALALIEFFENMVFRHGYAMVFMVVMGIPFFVKSRNKIIIFSFAYFLMFFIYFDQWVLLDLIRPPWYTKTLYDTVTYFGGIGTYTGFFKIGSTYSQIVSGFNIVLPVLFVYSAYKIIPKKRLKIAGALFILLLFYQSGIRPEVPVQLIGKADLQAAKWIRENTGKGTTFVANIGSQEACLWNISGITERKCLYYRPLQSDYLGEDPLAGIDFEGRLEENPEKALALLKKYKFTHLLISEESKLDGKEFPENLSLRKVFQYQSDGKISRVYRIL